MEMHKIDTNTDNLRVGLSKEINNMAIHRKYRDMYKYLYLDLGNGSIAYVVKGLYKQRTSELWAIAESNTFKETSIENWPIMPEVEFPLYIVTNKQHFLGASSILNKEALREFSEKHSVKKWLVLPSSIHEVIIIPFNNRHDIDHYSRIVKSINDELVDPKEQLSNDAYVLKV